MVGEVRIVNVCINSLLMQVRGSWLVTKTSILTWSRRHGAAAEEELQRPWVRGTLLARTLSHEPVMVEHLVEHLLTRTLINKKIICYALLQNVSSS